MDMKAEYETTINALLAENDKLIKLVDWQNEEIERLREALRKIAKSQLSDSEQAYIFKMLARAALGGEE